MQPQADTDLGAKAAMAFCVPKTLLCHLLFSDSAEDNPDSCRVTAYPEAETEGCGGAAMILPGETEAGNAWTELCRGTTWWADRDDERQRCNLLLALLLNPHRIGRPQCLENPRPKGGILTNGESPLSISR